MPPLTDAAPAEIRTERLVLARPSPDDADALFAIEGDPRTARFRPAGPRDRAGSDADLAQYLADWADVGLGYWMVRLDGHLVGTTGQRVLEVPDGRYFPDVEPETLLNTYYRFHPDVWGTGVPTEAARAALDATLALRLGLDVIAFTTPDNVPSQQMAVRLGMPFHRRVPVPDHVDSVEHRLRASA